MHINPVPWWDSDCERIIRQRKAAFKKFANTINFCTNISYVWNKCKIFKNKWTKVQPSNIKNNLQQKNDVQVALNKICPPRCETNPDWIPKCKSNSFLDQPFDPAEFNSVLENKKNTAASGLDGIDYEVIKSLPFDYRLILLDIFNEIY